MNRLAAIVGIILTTTSLGCHGRLSCFLPPNTPFSFGSGIGDTSDAPMTRRIHTVPLVHHDENMFRGDRSTHSNNYIIHQARRRCSSSICYMNKVPKFFEYQFPIADEQKIDDEESRSKQRGVFRRMRDKISTTFNGNGKEDEDNKSSSKKGQSKDNQGNKEIGYKPTPMDALRLRLAMAMSGLSNLNFFQFGKEEWVVACPKTRVGPGQIVPCSVNGLDIIIFASRDGQRLDAFANACPHLGSPFDLATIERKLPVKKDKGKAMDDGTGDGCVDCIVCPVHQTAFEIQSGQVTGEWCPYPPVLGGIM